jgi:hypothetical protein
VGLTAWVSGILTEDPPSLPLTQSEHDEPCSAGSAPLSTARATSLAVFLAPGLRLGPVIAWSFLTQINTMCTACWLLAVTVDLNYSSGQNKDQPVDVARLARFGAGACQAGCCSCTQRAAVIRSVIVSSLAPGAVVVLVVSREGGAPLLVCSAANKQVN